LSRVNIKRMKFDVLSLGPARMDCFVRLPDDEVNEICSIDRKRCLIELGFGEKIAVKGIEFAIGGNTGNNAVGLSRLGLKAAMIGAMGDGWTDKRAMEVLKEEGINTDHIEIQPGKYGFGVVINYQEERTILSYYPESLCCFPKEADLEADWMYLTSMGLGYESFYRDAVEWAKQHGVKLAFNPGTRQIKAGVEPLGYAYEATEVIFVNREETANLINMDPASEIKDLLGGLRKLGPKTAIITDGPEGAYAFDGQKYRHMPPVPAPVIERTGAGDAFGSGTLGALIAGKPLTEALKWGSCNSASVLGQIGPQAGLLTTEKMQEWLERNAGINAEEI